MNTIEKIKDKYQSQRAAANGDQLLEIEARAFENFNKLGIPTSKHEEWKFTRIAALFNRDYAVSSTTELTWENLAHLRLPGYEEANELVFVNGEFAENLSVVRSSSLTVMPLDKAAVGEHSQIVLQHLGLSGKYIRDGIHALNTAFVRNGQFIAAKKGAVIENPVYIYHITDARNQNIFSQPRMFMHVGENARISVVETYATLGKDDSFSNEVMEVIVEKDAFVEYYKIQNDAANTNLVSTTHFQQTGKCMIHAVTVTLGGGIIRNNLNIAMASDRSEAHLYGLYLLKGETHADNHTVVDNIQPNCQSNELYKGIIDENASAVFNGKIYVQPLAQKTNAFQSNKNILLSENATVNTKPQLEIFADDVKCSHGCTVGRLDEEGLFYLRSRGINETTARSMLVHAFAEDIIEHIKPANIRNYVDGLISERLELT